MFCGMSRWSTWLWTVTVESGRVDVVFMQKCEGILLALPGKSKRLLVTFINWHGERGIQSARGCAVSVKMLRLGQQLPSESASKFMIVWSHSPRSMWLLHRPSATVILVYATDSLSPHSLVPSPQFIHTLARVIFFFFFNIYLFGCAGS